MAARAEALRALLEAELKGSVAFFLEAANLDPASPGCGLVLDSTRHLRMASIAASGFALTAWVIAAERALLPRERALEITRRSLRALLAAPHYHGFFAHFLDIATAKRYRQCEFSTIDTALCLNGVVTAAAYFGDPETSDLAGQVLERVDWGHFVFEEGGRTLFRMAYNPDRDGDYAAGAPGFISQWDMAAEQKMMYLLAAPRLNPAAARALYRGFDRPAAPSDYGEIIYNPGGTLFCYLFTEAWLDAARWRDPGGVDWAENTRRAALACRDFCIRQAGQYRTYHERSWGLSAGDSPWGYDVSGAEPSAQPPAHNGTVSIWSALACLPYLPDEVGDMALYLREHHPQAWGPRGFYDAYNTAVNPPWVSSALYAIDKGCSMMMIENHLTRLVWDVYTASPTIQAGLGVLGFTPREDTHG